MRCLPPENKPLPVEFTQCRPFLQAEIAVMPELKVIVALGKGAHDQVLRALTVRPAGSYPFIHGRLHSLPTGLTLADSYHCSRYNTNTGRLTTEMFHDVFEAVQDAELSSRASGPSGRTDLAAGAALLYSAFSIAPVISSEPGRTRLGQAPCRLPSLPIRYLWKFHLGAAPSPASWAIH